MSESAVEFTKENIDLYFRESEENTKSLLLKFDEKYPGVLAEKNVDSVIESVGQNGEDKLSLKATLEQMKQMKKE